MKTFKKIGLVGAVAFALFAFNACGDDSNSTSASGENGSLSSAVEDDESSSSINDDSSSSVIPGSSSSVVSDSEGSSSSVKGSAPADVSSSSVISDPDRESSSSSVKSSSSSAKSSSSVETSDLDESSSSVDKKSSGNESTEKDKSSSSENMSSSSAKETKNSSDSKSSSSIKSGDSSSSKKDVSSSSESLSSSEKQSSSSSEKQSSSSSVLPKSSSSVFEVDSSRLCTPGYAFCNRALGADSMHAGAYKKFTYEGRSYYYLTINGENQDGKAASVTVMAENLNVGEMVDGNKDQNDDSKIERYCYDNDTTNCVEYGGLYQWAEMMGFNDSCNTKSCAHLIQENHQGICPDGWRLLTYDDMYVVVHANGNRNGVADIRSMGFGGFNYSGYGLIGAGLRKNGEFNGLETSTYWFYPIENAQYAYRAKSNSMWKDDDKPGIDMANQDKSSGVSVRCVMVE